MNSSSIIVEEFGGIMLFYGFYAFITCTVIQFLQYHHQLSDLGFQDLIQGNLTLFASSTLLFIILACCSWYELRLFGSHVLFLWAAVLLAFGLALSVSHIFHRHSGLILKSEWRSCIWNALFLTIPHILCSAFYSLLSTFEYGH